MRFRGLKRPFVFIQALRSPKLNEKPARELVSKAEWDKMIFFDFDGTQTVSDVAKQYRKVQELSKTIKASDIGTFNARLISAGDVDKSKYGKYFWHELSAEKRKYKWGRMPTTVLCVDNDLISG